MRKIWSRSTGANVTMMKSTILVGTLLLGSTLLAAEYHVSPSGDNANQGTRARPFRTIQRAADLAQPGDVITVHGGVYRERINPPRGGTSDKKRIIYQAARGEKVVITGSEPVKGWERVGGDTWKVVIPNKYFGRFNPYADTIHGDWFSGNGRRPVFHAFVGERPLGGDEFPGHRRGLRPNHRRFRPDAQSDGLRAAS